MHSFNQNLGNKMQKVRNKFVDRFRGKHENSKNSASTNVNVVESTGSTQFQLNWETDNASSEPVFRNLKWILIRDVHQCDIVTSFLQSKMDDKLYVGFDIEYDPCFVRGQTSRTALVQIAIHTGHCLLFQVSKLRHLPPLLTKLLVDPNIVKLGVGIHGDVKKIKKDFDVTIQGWCDLASIAPAAQKMGLAALTKDHLNTILPKSKSLVMSKWSKDLSVQKRAYAARDAYVAVLLLTKLVAKKLQIPESRVTQNDVRTCMKMAAGNKQNR